MRDLLKVFVVCISVSALAGCRTYDVIETSALPGVDFASYQSFAWLPDQADTVEDVANSRLVRDNIRNYFGQSMVLRGYRVDLDTPDLLLNIVVLNRKKEGMRVNSAAPVSYYCRYYSGSEFHFPYEAGYYYRNPYVYCYPVAYYAEKFEYLESSITFNVVDRKSDRLIWSGTAKGDIYDTEYLDRDIHPAVVAIMKRYPVKPVKVKTNKK